MPALARQVHKTRQAEFTDTIGACGALIRKTQALLAFRLP
jgi:hypothetical protein